jgi:hypothetical protein
MAGVSTWLQAIDRFIELATYIVWDQLIGTNLHQIADLRADLIYLKVIGALPIQIRNQFANEYHPGFIELRVNTLQSLYHNKGRKSTSDLRPTGRRVPRKSDYNKPSRRPSWLYPSW